MPGDHDRRQDDWRITEIHKSVENMEKMLTGDGEPEKGLVLRVVVLEAWKRWQSKLLWAFALGMVGSLGACIANTY